MNPLPTALLVSAAIVALSLTSCDPQVPYRRIPFAVQQYFSELPPWQKPKKVHIDQLHRRIYWLTPHGEIRAIGADGTQPVLVNKGIGAKLGITYINDFAIDSQEGVLYFTDLMDIASRQGAIKKSDLQGRNIKTLATFPSATPYAVAWDNTTQQLYYLIERKNTHDYGLLLLGRDLPIVTVKRKVNDISALLKGLPLPVEAHPVADGSAMIFGGQ